MATGKASDFVIYDALFNGAYNEKQTQNISAMLGGSNGAISITGNFLRGDYKKESFYKKISSLVTRRDVTSTSTATDLAVTQGEQISVKCHRKIGPVGQTESAWKQIGETPEKLSFVVGEQAADDVLAEKLNTALGAAVGALYHMGSAVTYDGTLTSPSATLTHGMLAGGLAKFGDASSRIVAWVMHSKPYFDLIGQAITDKITNVADVVIVSGSVATLGKPVIVTDSSSLINTTATPDQYVTLGLTQGAIQINDSETPRIVTDVITGLENLVFRMQGEYAYNLGLKGYAWDTSTGGANPTAAACAVGVNWDPVFTSYKDGVGVRILTA